MRRVSVSEVRDQICDGDLLLFRGRGLVARLIRIAGRSRYSHAARALWWRHDLFCCEVREWHGGRAVTLDSQVQKYPGAIDVFEANPGNRWPDYNRRAAMQFMRRLAGCDYGYLNVWCAALRHLPICRWFVHPPTIDPHRVRRPPFCSQACATADRVAGGVDPVPHLADRLTEPADLARSPFYRYRFTLARL